MTKALLNQLNEAVKESGGSARDNTAIDRRHDLPAVFLPGSRRC
jgi:hypothetical protein